MIDISHESLIRRWHRLRQWVEEDVDSGEWYRRVEDRTRIGGAYLVYPELEAALRARESGRWNEAWAERYATEKHGARQPYSKVIGFLDESRKRLTDDLSRIRRSLSDMLSDLSYVEKKCADGLIHELLADYDAALRSAGLGDDERAHLAGFARFIRAESQLLAAHRHLRSNRPLICPIPLLRPRGPLGGEARNPPPLPLAQQAANPVPMRAHAVRP